MGKYRKKPVVIEAYQLTEDNFESLVAWCGGSPAKNAHGEIKGISVFTLEGVMTARFGDWVIKGVQGEYYPCKPEIFKKTYEPVEAEDE